MKTELELSSWRQRSINTPEDLIKMLAVSVFLHMFFVGAGVWVANKLEKTRIYVPAYTVNLVSSVPAMKKEVPQQKLRPKKKKPARIKKVKKKIKEKKVAVLKKKKAEPTPTPIVVVKKAKPTPVSTRPVAVAKKKGPEGVSVPKQALTLDTIRFPYLWYLKNIQVTVNQNWSTLGIQDSPTPTAIFFRIMRDGSVQDVKIEESSGNTNLDNSAIQAVILSSPFDPLPDGYSGRDLAIHYNFTFSGNNQ